jgi:YVTN family beta-propeller protein
MKTMRRLPLLLAATALTGLASAQTVLLVANQGDRTLSIVDTAAGSQIAAVAEGEITGHEVIASADGRTAFLPIYGNSGVGKPGTDGSKMLAIDIASQKVTRSLDFAHGVRPHCPILGPDGMLYVTTELDQTISVIDPASLKIVATIPTGQAESHMLVLSHDGRRGYTANVGPGTVSVLDIRGRKKVAIIPISKTTQRISISPDDKLVFTADQVTPRIVVIDTATDKIKTSIPIPAPGYGTASTPDGHWLLVAVPSLNQVAAVDLTTMKVAKTLDVPKAPQEIVITPDGKTAYVSCNSSGKVAAIDVANWKVDKLIDAGKGADGLALARR